jgi:flagellar basal body P-ring protein FlgI
MTPMQDATLSIPDILAIAGGRIDLTDEEVPTRGIIRGGATIEEDLFYNFIDDGYITLVIADSHAGWPMAQLIAKAINQELASPELSVRPELSDQVRQDVEPEAAVAIGPKNVRVKIPPWELPKPAWIISQILQTQLFVMPQQEARVFINRLSKQVSFTGNVTISPTVLLIPGMGTVTVGEAGAAGTPGMVGLDTQEAGGVPFQQLMDTLSRMKLTGEQLIGTIEQLASTGTLHAQIAYTE